MQSFKDYLNESKEELDEKRAPKMKSLGTQIKKGEFKGEYLRIDSFKQDRTGVTFKVSIVTSAGDTKAVETFDAKELAKITG